MGILGTPLHPCLCYHSIGRTGARGQCRGLGAKEEAQLHVWNMRKYVVKRFQEPEGIKELNFSSKLYLNIFLTLSWPKVGFKKPKKGR